MRNGLTRRSAALFFALILAGAAGAAFARSGGGHSGFYQGGGGGAPGGPNASHSMAGAGAHGAGFRRYSSSIRTGGHFRHGDDDERRRHEFGFGDRPWGEAFRGSAFAGWPLISLYHRYGDGDFQPCMRRDGYGDLYQAC